MTDITILHDAPCAEVSNPAFTADGASITMTIAVPDSLVSEEYYRYDSSPLQHAIDQLASLFLCLILLFLFHFFLEQVGAILGRAGCVVKEIMSLSGTQIQVGS